LSDPLLTPHLALAAALRVQHGGIPDAGAVCSALVAELDPRRDVICLVRPGSRLDHHLRRLVPKDRLFHLAARPNLLARDTSPGEWELVAGSEDLDIPPSASLPWPHPTRPGFRRRRLDTLFPAQHRVGLIVMDDPRHAPDLLRGAAAILARSAPAVVLDLAVLPVAARLAAWAECAELLDAAGYDWHDGLLLRCGRDPLVVETLLDPVVCAIRSPPVPLLSGLALRGWSPPVRPAHPVERPSVTRFDADLPCRGFYPPESDGRAIWRWTGQDAPCAFAVRVPGPGRWRITLDVANWGVVDEADALSVQADGVPLACQGIEGGRIRFGDIDIAPATDHGCIIVALATPRPRPWNPGDPRAVGIALLQASLDTPPAGAG